MVPPKSSALSGLLLAALLAMPAAGQGLSQGFDQDGVEISPDGTIEGDEGFQQELEPELPLSAGQSLAGMIDAPKARLRGLDTLTNSVNDFEIEVGQTLAFKRLIVKLEACRYPPDDPLSEALAFLVIQDRREAEPRFSGWMLASSPAFSALDHPRYDIWVLSCSAS